MCCGLDAKDENDKARADTSDSIGVSVGSALDDRQVGDVCPCLVKDHWMTFRKRLRNLDLSEFILSCPWPDIYLICSKLHSNSAVLLLI